MNYDSWSPYVWGIKSKVYDKSKVAGRGIERCETNCNAPLLHSSLDREKISRVAQLC
jgi:hypothetical protein